MDTVEQIKSRLPIEELVRHYCQLQRKGRNYVALCPFHQDSRPSFVVSPDKGICYCFPCQKGGDIFSFYQLIEQVDFPQALKDLAERTGVELPDRRDSSHSVDERDRIRSVLQAAQALYRDTLRASTAALEYVRSRGITPELEEEYGLGLAPASFSATYEHLLKAGHSRSDIVAAGIGVAKELGDDRVYDRFRNRLMFPIADSQGRIIGFGGRDMHDVLPVGDDREAAKYLNSAETSLYHKSSVLYGLDRALPSMRAERRVVLVEGYVDVLACRAAGVQQVVATCGTALTEDHVRLLKRSVDTVVLCMDTDDAGTRAADRACCIAQQAGLQVERVVLAHKDPGEALLASADQLRIALQQQARPFIASVCEQIQRMDVQDANMRRAALLRLLPLLQSIASSTERSHAVRLAAAALQTTETALTDDLRQAQTAARTTTQTPASEKSPYGAAELSVALLLLYPVYISMAKEILPLEEGLSAALLRALAEQPAGSVPDLQTLQLSEVDRNAASVLLLYCEEAGFADWSDAVALREIRRNIHIANREVIVRKQKAVTAELASARREGRTDDERRLSAEYAEVLCLAKKLTI